MTQEKSKLPKCDVTGCNHPARHEIEFYDIKLCNIHEDSLEAFLNTLLVGKISDTWRRDMSKKDVIQKWNMKL